MFTICHWQALSSQPLPRSKVQAVALLPADLSPGRRKHAPLAVSRLSQDTSLPSPAHPRPLIGRVSRPPGR
jgi:hypothetical protein